MRKSLTPSVTVSYCIDWWLIKVIWHFLLKMVICAPRTLILHTQPKCTTTVHSSLNVRLTKVGGTAVSGTQVRMRRVSILVTL